MQNLRYQRIQNYTTVRNIFYDQLDISYQSYGPPIGKAPVVLVNHALTGNSDLTSPEKGWWRTLVGEENLVNTNIYTVIAFNIPGNGYDDQLIDHYQDFTARDIAKLFYLALDKMGIRKLYAAIGGSLGGGIAWEMAAEFPDFIEYLIPVAADWKSSDWIIGHNSIQESILLNSTNPLEDARKMAMLFYRTPASFTQKFNRSKREGNNQFNVSSWLNHHGKKLKGRFDRKAYLLMNHLLSHIDITSGRASIESTLNGIKSTIIQVAIDTDLFFVKEENKATKKILDTLKKENYYYEIKSIHGHDAFLIEDQQLFDFLRVYF